MERNLDQKISDLRVIYHSEISLLNMLAHAYYNTPRDGAAPVDPNPENPDEYYGCQLINTSNFHAGTAEQARRAFINGIQFALDTCPGILLFVSAFNHGDHYHEPIDAKTIDPEPTYWTEEDVDEWLAQAERSAASKGSFA